MLYFSHILPYKTVLSSICSGSHAHRWLFLGLDSWIQNFKLCNIFVCIYMFVYTCTKNLVLEYLYNLFWSSYFLLILFNSINFLLHPTGATFPTHPTGRPLLVTSGRLPGLQRRRRRRLVVSSSWIWGKYFRYYLPSWNVSVEIYCLEWCHLRLQKMTIQIHSTCIYTVDMYVFDGPPLCCFVLQEPAWSAALPAAHLRVAALPMPMGHGQEVHGCLVLGGHLTTRGKSGRAIRRPCRRV